MIKLHGFIKYLDYNFDSASLEFEKCKSLGDTSLFIYKHLGNCYFVLDNYEKAILNLKEAYNRDQNDFDVIYAIGLSALKTDSIDLAKKFLKRSLNLVTPSHDFLSELYQANAEAYTKNFEYQKALNYYLLAHEKTPDNKYLNYKIANHYDMLIHDQENAIQYYENYLALEDRTDSLPFSHDTLKKDTKNAEYVKNRLNKLNEEKFWEGKMK